MHLSLSLPAFVLASCLGGHVPGYEGNISSNCWVTSKASDRLAQTVISDDMNRDGLLT